MGIDAQLLNQKKDRCLKKGFKSKEYDGFAFGKQVKIKSINEIISVYVDFNYSEKRGLLSIHRYPHQTLNVCNFKYSCMIPKAKTIKYRFAIFMQRSGTVLEVIHYYCSDR